MSLSVFSKDNIKIHVDTKMFEMTSESDTVNWKTIIRMIILSNYFVEWRDRKRNLKRWKQTKTKISKYKQR